MRSNGPSWTLADVVEMIGQVRVIETPFGTSKWRVDDGRLTSDARRAEFLVTPA